MNGTLLTLIVLAVVALGATFVFWRLGRRADYVGQLCLRALEGQSDLTPYEVLERIERDPTRIKTSRDEVAGALNRLAEKGLVVCKRREDKLKRLYSPRAPLRSVPRSAASRTRTQFTC